MISTNLGAVGLVRGVHGDFFLPRNDLILEQIRAFGAHTRPEIAMIRRFVGLGDTVVDIGAHVGTFALPLAYSVGWTGRVLAFEPNPASVEFLRLNVVLNGLQSVIHISNLALAATSSDYFVVGNRTANSGASYLVSGQPPPPTHRRRHSDAVPDDGPDPAGEPGGSVVDLVDPVDKTGPMVSVAATTLDRFLAESDREPRPVSLIKIDVEGMEESVIAGATETIESDRPVLYFEVAVEQAKRSGLPDLVHLDYLTDLGYRLMRNVAARNGADDEFELEVVNRQMLAEVIEANEVIDLAAIPEETSLERHP